LLIFKIEIDVNYNMIELYAILRNYQTLELCITNNSQKKSIESLLIHICKKIKNQTSRLIKTFVI